MQPLPPFDEMYQALVDKDSHYEGVFIVGVKTTGIFCRPTCSARKPKRENVEFFAGIKQALDHGYRACKVCTPMKALSEQPDWIKGLLQEVYTTVGKKWKDNELTQLGYSPSKIRRYFKVLPFKRTYG